MRDVRGECDPRQVLELSKEPTCHTARPDRQAAPATDSTPLGRTDRRRRPDRTGGPRRQTAPAGPDRAAGWKPFLEGYFCCVNPIAPVIRVVMRLLRAVDRFQQRNKPASFVFAVLKKYGDDNAGVAVSNMAYAGMAALFPLLLVMVTALGLVVGGNSKLQNEVQHSVLIQFPIIGSELLHNIRGLNQHSTAALMVGLVGVSLGSLGVAQAGIYAMERIWNLPASRKANWWQRLGRTVAFLGVLGLGVILTTAAAGFGTFGGNTLPLEVLGEVVAVVLNVLQYVLAFRVLTPKSVPTSELLPGAVVGAVAWTVLQAVGGYLVGHQLRHDRALYGTFGLVLGLMAWIYLGARITMYAAEVNTVLFHRLWPRGFMQPPLTPADHAALTLQARWAEKRPEESLEVRFTDEARFDGQPPCDSRGRVSLGDTVLERDEKHVHPHSAGSQRQSKQTS